MSLKAGNLCDLLEKLPSIRSNHHVLAQLLRHILEALDYLAFRGWCHRDVKPDNILYTPSGDNSCLFQLADFGFVNQQRFANTFCGSLPYMAPEMVYGNHPQSPKLDVWSLFVVIGVVMQAGGLGDPKLASYEEVLTRVRAAATQHSTLSPMAQENPELRASAAQMLAKCFDGHGLSTPRNQVSPIPDPVRSNHRPQNHANSSRS
jgi:serine/threonine protein kinase